MADPSRRARDRHRPEPRRHVREGAGREAPRPRRGHRHARLPVSLAALGPPARARPGRPGQRARHRARARDVLRELPAREVLPALPRGARGRVPRGRGLRRRLLQERRHRELEVVPRPGGRRARRGQSRPTAAWASTPRPSSPSPTRSGASAAATRCCATTCRARPRRPWRSPRPSRRRGPATVLPWPTARADGLSARRARAVSRAVGRCQVANQRIGKRGFGLAGTATPPSVEKASPA